MTTLEIAEQVGEKGFCICPDFLSKGFLESMRIDLSAIYAAGKFRRAGVGNGGGHEVRDHIRRDEIYWLDREGASAIQNELWLKFDELKTAFNRTLFLGLKELEAHYSFYPKGGFYDRHLDSFQKGNARLVSLVLYLNENWKPEDAGSLRLYSADSFSDVAPVSGTLVCFLSRETEHEVLKTNADRYSLAGWFRS